MPYRQTIVSKHSIGTFLCSKKSYFVITFNLFYMARLTQQELLDIFNALKKILKPYEKGNLNARFDMEGRYELWSEKDMIVYGRQRKEIQFAALIIQSSYVGFYFMPYYASPDTLGQYFAPGLLKCLKGKSCFHIKTSDKEMLSDVKAALKLGFEEYKNNGWI